MTSETETRAIAKVASAARMPVWLPLIELACAGLAGVLWYQQGGATWYAGDWPGPWPLALLAVPWALRLRLGLLGRPGWADALLVLFLASAALGVSTAYATGPALAKFWLLVGAVAVYYALARQPDLQHMYFALGTLGVFGVALALYSFMTNDWAVYPVKVPVLVALGEWISAHLPTLAAHRIHPNVIGGSLALIWPFYVPLIMLAGSSRRVKLGAFLSKILPVVWGAALLLVSITWLVVSSRGAWLGLATAASLWVIWRLLGRWYKRFSRLLEPKETWGVRLCIMAGIVVAGLGALGGVALLLPGSGLPGAGAVAGRLGLLSNELLLARDYFFIGAGLGTNQMQYSTYTLLIHVGYIIHSHNMFLNLLIEQGIAGLAMFLGVAGLTVVAGMRRLRRAHDSTAWVVEAALAGLVAMLVHGLVDDVLYGSRGALLLYVPAGIVMATWQWNTHRDETPLPARLPSAYPRATALGTLALLLAVALWNSTALLGAWYANLGAVEQSRVELRAYGLSSDFRVMDEIRRGPALEPALALFRQALAVDPGNATARQRLAQVALARGEYPDALVHAQAAWDAGNRDRVTRLVLGDALVANGRPVEAAEVVRGLEWVAQRMAGYGWGRYWVAGDWPRAADAYHAAVLLDPGDKASADAEAEARRRAGGK